MDPLKRIKLLWLLAYLIAAGAFAETAYITDELQLGLHRAADTGDSPMRSLVSGTELEILERTRLYARVRTPDGSEGWVKAAYLISEKPAAARVMELEAENSQVSARLNTVLEQTSDVRKSIDALEAQLAEASEARDIAVTEAGELREENERFESRMSSYRDSVPMTWAMIAAGLMLMLGLFAGFMFFDYRSRKRFGGFRVY